MVHTVSAILLLQPSRGDCLTQMFLRPDGPARYKTLLRRPGLDSFRYRSPLIASTRIGRVIIVLPAQRSRFSTASAVSLCSSR